MSDLHVILGASGAIGTSIYKELKSRGLDYRLVERSKDIPGEPVEKADITDLEQLKRVIRGSKYVYCCVGLPYNLNVWKKDWPMIAKNLVEACTEQSARLIFFDNIYAYGPAPLQTPITEQHPVYPVSQKGQVRKQVQQILEDGARQRSLAYIIARAGDFYGPGVKLSVLYASCLENILQNKSPQTIFPIDKIHTFTHTGDAGRACVHLALDHTAYNQVWHLPTTEENWSIGDIINYWLENTAQSGQKIQEIPGFLVSILGWVQPIIKELEEMKYQYESDYVFSSAKFNQKYPEFEITEYERGLLEMLDSFKK